MKKYLKIFLSFSIICLLVFCVWNNFIRDTTNPYAVQDQNNNSSDQKDKDNSSDQKDPIINMVTSSKIGNESILTLEEQICAVIENALTSTLCVYNYQEVREGFYSSRYEEQLYSFGSGVVYFKSEKNNDGEYIYRLITNEHVVEASGTNIKLGSKGRYTLYDGVDEVEMDATLLGADAEADIAVLEFTTDREYNGVTFAKEEEVKVGKFVLAIGTPVDVEYYNTVTLGIVSKITDTFVQHDAAINSGNSGGPLFNIYGELVGINNSKLSGTTSSGAYIEGMLFAIPLSIVSKTVFDITGYNDIVYSS